MTRRKGSHKRIMEIHKINWNTVEVEYFDMYHNYYSSSKRKVKYPSNKNRYGAYIIWEGSKKIVESVME